jgi:hypothetical protein
LILVEVKGKTGKENPDPFVSPRKYFDEEKRLLIEKVS